MCAEDVRPLLFLLDHTFQLVLVYRLIVVEQKGLVLNQFLILLWIFITRLSEYQ